MTLGDEEKELTLEGESSLPHKPMTVGEYVPADCSSKVNDIPVYFSTDCIDVSHVATHSHVMRMIMVHNNLEHDALAYEWKRSVIPGILNVEIHPPKGLIKPRTVQSFRVTINTEGLACVIDVNVPCEFINTGHRRAYQRSVYKYEDLSRELEGQFTITEKEISVPMLFVIIHEEFALKTIHLIQHTDIRHTSYLNIVSGMNRRKTTKRETRLLYQDSNHSDVKISKLPSLSRISFYEKS